MLYVIGGASGSGKTTVLPYLRSIRPDVRWHDFDERYAGGGKAERQQLLESWIVTATEYGEPFGLLGQCPLGELVAAPSAPKLSGYRHLLLDIGDVERVQRLQSRGDGLADQDVLNWAAWLRVHEMMPDWRADVLTDGGWPEMRWERWTDMPSPSWPGGVLNASGLSPEQTAERIAGWISEVLTFSPRR